MDNLIFTASPFQAFISEILLATFLIVFGLVNMIYPLFSRRDKVGKRIITILLGVVLILAGSGMGIAVYHTFQGGEKTVQVKVEDKREVTRKCGSSSWRTCTSYVVEATDGAVYYDFTMDEDVWSKITPGACYAVTYYPPKPLLDDYLPKGEYDDLYQTGSDLTRIERIVCR